MVDVLKRFSAPRAASAPQTPLLERSGGGERGTRDARDTSPTPSAASSFAAPSSAGGSAAKRPRPSPATATDTPSGAPPIGDDAHLALLGQGIADAAASRTSNAPAFANDAEIEKEYFSPFLVDTNAARRKICATVEKLGTLLVDLPADRILSASSRDFTTAALRDGADESAFHEECTSLMAEVVEQFEALRVATAQLRRSCSHMMRIYMLAHHTTGAGWNTVAQLCYRDAWDREMLGLQASRDLGREGDGSYAHLQARQAPHQGGGPHGTNLPSSLQAELRARQPQGLQCGPRPPPFPRRLGQESVRSRRLARWTPGGAGQGECSTGARPPPPPGRRRRLQRPLEEQSPPTQSIPSPPPCACRKAAAWSQSRGLTAQRGPPRESAGGQGEGGEPPPPPPPPGAPPRPGGGGAANIPCGYKRSVRNHQKATTNRTLGADVVL
jgi:hypothetical protein